MKLRLIILFLLIVGYQNVFSQDTLSVKEIYFDNNLAYQGYNDKLFTGVAQKLRKNGNGHIVAEEIYKNGVLLEWKLFYNKSHRRLAENVFYYKKYPLAPKERIRYTTNEDGKFTERTYYDTNFKKTLVTRHKDTTLIYKCPYTNGKKDGEEFCLNDNGNPIITKFIIGKKVKNGNQDK